MKSFFGFFHPSAKIRFYEHPAVRLLGHGLFYSVFMAWTVGMILVACPFLLGTSAHAMAWLRWWCLGVLALGRGFLGVSHRIVGGDLLAQAGPHIVACQHESVWETIALCALVDRPIFVLKSSLLYLPVFGWFFRKLGMIPVRRGRGAPYLIDQSRQAIQAGHSLIIFPQGTRVAPGQDAAYRSGVYKLAAAFPDVPVIPLALNSGDYWPRHGFFKRPGEILLQVFPPLFVGADQADFMRRLKSLLTAARLQMTKDNCKDSPEEDCKADCKETGTLANG
jgi:1-acyl-sn-glycerol-3-phosphate acyltransferase